MMETLDACAKISLAGADCLINLLQLRAVEGQCSSIVDDSPHLALKLKNNGRHYRLVASALASIGRSPSAIESAMADAWKADAARPDAAGLRLFDHASLAMLRGDFDEALNDFDKLDELADEMDRRMWLVRTARMRVDMFAEMGDKSRELGVAQRFVDLRHRTEVAPSYGSDPALRT